MGMPWPNPTRWHDVCPLASVCTIPGFTATIYYHHFHMSPRTVDTALYCTVSVYTECRRIISISKRVGQHWGGGGLKPPTGAAQAIRLISSATNLTSAPAMATLSSTIPATCFSISCTSWSLPLVLTPRVLRCCAGLIPTVSSVRLRRTGLWFTTCLKKDAYRTEPSGYTHHTASDKLGHAVEHITRRVQEEV